MLLADSVELMCFFFFTTTGPPQKVSNCTFTVQQANDAETSGGTAEAAQDGIAEGRRREREESTSATSADMVTKSTTRNHSATFMLTKEAGEQHQYQHQHHQQQQQHHSAHLPSVVVRCVGGRDGGQTQTFHLIGLVAGESNLEGRSSPLMNGAHESEQHVGNVSSIIELIQSIQPSWGSVGRERTKEQHHQPQQQRAPSVQWNVSANEVAQFVLANVTLGQQYDLIIYAENLIGRSAALLYRNLLLLNGKPHTLTHTVNITCRKSN